MPEPVTATVDERAATTMEGGIEVTRLIDGEKLKVGVATGDPGDKEKWHEHKDEVEEVY
jgi:quercetin dioxygenase-like cupin family protein